MARWLEHTILGLIIRKLRPKPSTRPPFITGDTTGAVLIDIHWDETPESGDTNG